MSVSRRRLLHNSILAAAAYAACPLFAWTGQKSGSNGSSSAGVESEGLQRLDRAAFTSAIGTGFQVTPTSGKSSPVWLRLLAVKDLPALDPVNTASMAVPPPKQRSAVVQTAGFMLVFLGTLPKPLPQGTYTFEHSGLGKFSLLIVPDGGQTQTYTAVINRLP